MRKAELVDAPERRSVAAGQFEFRSTGGNSLKLSGHASVFNKGYEVHGGPGMGGWTEVVTQGAFKRTLSENPHVHLLINHEGLPLASTKSGTLRLSTDSQGLLTEANLDLRDPDVQSLEVKMERGDVDEMSFAFRVKTQRWGNNDELRYLDEVSLHKGDVSIVNFGANPHTSAQLRSALKKFARGELDDRQVAELRSILIGSRRKGSLIGRAGFEDGDVFDQGEPEDSTLAQAIHDLCADQDGVTCDPTNLNTPMYESNSRNMSVAEAMMLADGASGNLTVREAKRIARGGRR